MSSSNGLIEAVMSWAGYRRLVYVLVPIAGFFVVLDWYSNGLNFACWNWMFYTGAATFAVTVALAIEEARKLGQTIEALRTNNTLVLSADEISQLKKQMETRARVWRGWCAIAIFLLVFGSWCWVVVIQLGDAGINMNAWQQLRSNFDPTVLALSIALILCIIAVMGVCGFYAGAFFGASAGHGAFASILSSDQTRLRIRPDHFDGAVGLKPIGDLYLFQALLTGIPLIWFVVWWVLIPAYQSTVCASVDYSAWRGPIVLMWLVTLCFTYLGFIRPILQLRKRVFSERTRLRSEVVPDVRQRIRELQKRLASEAVSAPEADRINSEIDRMASYIWSIDRMSSWPMDAATRRKYFSVHALVAVAPPFVETAMKIDAIRAGFQATGSWQWLQSFPGIIF